MWLELWAEIQVIAAIAVVALIIVVSVLYVFAVILDKYYDWRRRKNLFNRGICPECSGIGRIYDGAFNWLCGDCKGTGKVTKDD